MYIDTSELCDIYADQVDVVEPIFSARAISANPLLKRSEGYIY